MVTESEDFSKLPVGALIAGRYEILGEVGEGGFAVVYKGLDIEIDREVAIKVLDLESFRADHEAYDNVLKRFRREARTSARIQHPNAVTIYDFGETEQGWPFIAMELLKGHDLEEELARHGAVTLERAVRLFIPCLEALGKAHERGIVHKDLKPSNLFIADVGTEQERLVILDFGVARLNSGDDTAKLTSAGQVLGTPQYMAPEYIESQTATPALDVYQMGLILAEAVSGTALVDEDNMVTCLILHTTGGFTVPTEVVHSPLGPVIAHALQKDHLARYEDGHAFRSALIDLGVLNTLTMRKLQDSVRGEDGGGDARAVDDGAKTEVVSLSTLPEPVEAPEPSPSGESSPPARAQGGDWGGTLLKIGLGAGLGIGLMVLGLVFVLVVVVVVIFAAL